jgi:mono/diheme cytochrome c family protein
VESTKERNNGRKSMKIILMLFALLTTGAAAGMAADAKAGKAAYDKACKSCHGAEGSPNQAIAKMMKVEMRELKSTEVQGMSDSDLEKVITEGMGKMKPIRSVNSADVVAYVRSLKK